VTVVGTEATNEVRYEPIVKGKFTRVELARVAAGGSTLGIGDLNPHLSYATATVPQSERDKSIGDPRGIAWNSNGTRGYVTGMGSNNVVVVDASGNRAGITPTIDVGEGPTGVVVDDARGRVYVLDKFAAAVSIVDVANEVEVARVPFFDPSPSAIKVGRKHLYDTHKNSGLGQIACGSCHVDARMDHLAWDLGDPSGAMKATTGQNLGANFPGLNAGFQPWHPMKGPMTTQTLQDIVGKEPLHWRGDRAGLEEFNGAFLGLQGDDTNLTPAEMQQFEDFLATITIPPNPNRNFDNTLPSNLPLPGQYTTGRFGPAGQPLPNGNAVQGLSDYRTLLLDGGAIRCVTCHTLPIGIGTDYTFTGGTLQPIAPGPNGERHHMLVSVDGTSNVTTKVPQLRTLYEKVGFETTQVLSRAGFGFLHDGGVDSIARFVDEPVFNLTSDQQTANLVAFMMSFAGSDLPQGSPSTLTEPPGTASKDTHAAVGQQTTLVDASSPAAGQLALIASMITQANTNKVGLVVKGDQGGLPRGWAYVSGSFRSDRASEPLLSSAALQALAAPGSELSYTVVPKGSETRIGIDRDLDGAFDRDEIDVGTDPADPASHAGAPGTAFCAGNGADPLVTTPCPCGNFGALAHGCANSVVAEGAQLAANGTTSPDTVVLSCSGAPPTATAVFLQGDLLVAAGAVFGDGVRCVGGNLKRIGVVASIAGTSHYPGPGDPSITAKSALLGDAFGPGATRWYQTYYRDANLAFCAAPTGASWNVSNGQRITW
jgi:YVTN family beta-propeller protein